MEQFTSAEEARIRGGVTQLGRMTSEQLADMASRHADPESREDVLRAEAVRRALELRVERDGLTADLERPVDRAELRAMDNGTLRDLYVKAATIGFTTEFAVAVGMEYRRRR